MNTIVVRAWLPDRPGALGSVASRIGAVRGDVVGIEIIERGGGQVIDELTVELPDDTPIELLEIEISQVEDVRIEEIRELGGGVTDPVLSVLDALARASAAPDPADLLSVVADWLRLDWVAAVGGSDPIVSWGDGTPDATWLEAFSVGAAATPLASHPADLALAPLALDRMLVAGRARPAFSTIERRRLACLVDVVGRGQPAQPRLWSTARSQSA